MAGKENLHDFWIAAIYFESSENLAIFLRRRRKREFSRIVRSAAIANIKEFPKNT